MLWLAREAFFGHAPFPLVHVDTSCKIPEMIAYRDRLARELRLNRIVGRSDDVLARRETYPDGAADRLTGCSLLKTRALTRTLDGTGPRYRLDRATSALVPAAPEAYTGVIAGIRADEEGSRSEERYFSPRSRANDRDIAYQPPEFWNQLKTEFAPGTHVRIHPLLDWTQLNIWEYIERERIPVVPLYFDHGAGRRYRSLGCQPCTAPVDSTARNASKIAEALRSGRFARVAERSGRAQDQDDGGVRKSGYM